MDATTLIVAAPGWIVSGAAALVLIGKLPVNIKRWDRDRIESEHERIEREDDLAEIAQHAEIIAALPATLNDITSELHANTTALATMSVQFSPNGGNSLRDRYDRIPQIEERVSDLEGIAVDHTERIKGHDHRVTLLESYEAQRIREGYPDGGSG